MGDLTKIVTSEPVLITDGLTQICGILAGAPTGTESGLIVRPIPSGTQTITGTVVTSGTQNIVGTVSTVPTGTQTVIGTVAISSTITTVPSGTQPVSGTVSTSPNRSSTSNLTTITAATSSTSLLSINSVRLAATVFNNSSSANLFIRLGTAASTTAFTLKMGPYGYYEVPGMYLGAISGVWDAASGSANVTELS